MRLVERGGNELEHAGELREQENLSTFLDEATLPTAYCGAQRRPVLFKIPPFCAHRIPREAF